MYIKTTIWQELLKHSQQAAKINVEEQFTLDPCRFKKFSLQAANLFLDYSKNRITQDTINLLCQLLQPANLLHYREELFGGGTINFTEGRKVLHTTLRNINDKLTSEGKLVNQELQRIAAFVANIHNGTYRGVTHKTFTDIVNIGIGGSDLGPAMVVDALKPYATQLKIHFVSNLDITHISATIENLNPETTLFIVASKTFTTQETISNANIARNWLVANLPQQENIIHKHFIGVTSNPQLAREFGIKQEYIFPFWEWVGGRFSVWSAIGISVALAIGMDNFYGLLHGAYEMDQHFKSAPPHQNMPIILALIGIWNINFLHAKSLAIIPYAQSLHLLPSYLQQLEMESNGKRTNRDGLVVEYDTAPIIWGTVGTNSQHSFHQLLMQGTHLVPVDFILPRTSHHQDHKQHALLCANCLAQSKALMCGRSEQEVKLELAKKHLDPTLLPHKIIPGNTPSNTIILPQVTPQALGSLLALYEHKIFVQGIIWQINSFDQWGVELGKHLANKLAPILHDKQDSLEQLDGSTAGLVKYLRSL